MCPAAESELIQIDEENDTTTSIIQYLGSSQNTWPTCGFLLQPPTNGMSAALLYFFLCYQTIYCFMDIYSFTYLTVKLKLKANTLL